MSEINIGIYKQTKLDKSKKQIKKIAEITKNVSHTRMGNTN